MGLYGEMDASEWLARRPGSWWLLIWTPVGCRRGVQIGDLGRIGRLLGIVVASRLEMYGGLDASRWFARHPDCVYRMIWTPVGCWRGIQIGVAWRIERQWAVDVASRLEMYGGMDASERLARRPDCVYRLIWTPIVNNRGVQILGGC